MAKTLVFNVGNFNLQSGKTANLFWDVPEYPGNTAATWSVTAWPEGVLDGPAQSEQRVEVSDLFLLRKGPDVPIKDRNKLQLNFNIKNIGNNPSNGRIIISAIVVS
jgi:hypothetical protein